MKKETNSKMTGEGTPISKVSPTLEKTKLIWKTRGTKIIVLVLLLGMIIGGIGLSFALFSVGIEKTKTFTIRSEELTYTLASSELNNSKQVTVAAGKRSMLSFEITSQSALTSLYKIYYKGTTDSNIKVSYIIGGSYTGTGMLAAKEKETVQILIENNSGSNVTLTFGIQGGLVGKTLTLDQGKELTSSAPPVYTDTSGANSPVLVEGMIPVVYDEAVHMWMKADVNHYYAYQDQVWANAVTVTSTNRVSIMNAPVGTPIPMDDINTMWVWIPRYEYQYTNLGDQYAGGTKDLPGEIKVNFISKNATAPSNASTYKIHPAFTFGDKELSGLWYGKFEISTKETCTPVDNSVGTACDLTTLTPQIIPNATSWLGARTSTFFTASRAMQTTKYATYGFTSSTTYDTHMSKNSEWGAVVYLSQGKYGKYGNTAYAGIDKKVAINNCREYITGVGGDSVNASLSSTTCTTNTYETVKGQSASTTGNITGVYDMSGGSWEYVMGVLADSSGKPRSGNQPAQNSGFNGMTQHGAYTSGIDFPAPKYYDLYATTDMNIACSGGLCYGQALSETAGWYSGAATFVDAISPWMQRGGGNGNAATTGAFRMSSEFGDAGRIYGGRFALTP